MFSEVFDEDKILWLMIKDLKDLQIFCIISKKKSGSKYYILNFSDD